MLSVNVRTKTIIEKVKMRMPVIIFSTSPQYPLLVKRGAMDWNARKVPVGRKFERLDTMSLDVEVLPQLLPLVAI